MIKISNREIIDIVRYSDSKMIFAEKPMFGDIKNCKASYFILNFETGEKEAVTTKVYLLKKFGFAFEKICSKITDFTQCDTVVLKNKDVLVLFPDGQAGLFNREGEMIWNKKLTYKNMPVMSLAEDGDYFWCVCKDGDCAIRYNSDNFNIDIRIGAKGKGTFNSPAFLSSDRDNIYVCCADRVRKISKDNLTVTDIPGLYDVPKKFYKVGRYSIIGKADGTYIDKDE
ncbi:MAG: hypothetical protein IJS03_07225 [Eubacterium sp.]|nr:hypothetical protein [Eubacterium sp.]